MKMNLFTKIFQLVESNRSMAILAVFGTAFAIYSTYFYEKRPEITIRTDSLSRVFDLYKPVGNLKILYADQDLRSSKKQLWAMNISITNSGGTDIRKSDFDETVPFGLIFSNAEIVDTPTLNTSDTYLQEHLKMKVNANQIVISPAMFDTQDSFGISLLLLSSDVTVPSVSGIGKIAGVKQFKIEKPDSKTSNKTLWEMLTGADSLWVQFARLFVYGFGSLLALTLLVLVIALIVQPVSSLFERLAKNKRQDNISKFNPRKDLSRETRFLSELYVSKGESAITSTWNVIRQLKHRLELIQQLSTIKDEALFWSIVQKMAPIKKTYWIFDELSKGGLLNIEDEVPRLSESLETSLKELANYLGIKLEEHSFGIDIDEYIKDLDSQRDHRRATRRRIVSSTLEP